MYGEEFSLPGTFGTLDENIDNGAPSVARIAVRRTGKGAPNDRSHLPRAPKRFALAC